MTWRWLGIACVAAALALLTGWLVVLSSQQPADHVLARLLPWPVACTTRGCLTTARWRGHLATARTFTATVGTPAPDAATSLTTLVRQHLVAQASVRAPVTAADARRYRETILNARDEDQIRKTYGVSAQVLDRTVILPYLLQEAVRVQRHAETLDELFRQLAQERWVLVLPLRYRWDTQTGAVVTR